MVYAQSSAEWDVPGPNGQQVAYTICYTTVALRTNFWGSGQRYNFSFQYEYENGEEYELEQDENYGGGRAIQSIVLPDGTYWGFIYDSGDPSNNNNVGQGPGNYGTITKLLLPGGGSISYTYSLGWDTPCYPQDPYGDSWTGAGTPMIATRTVSDNNGDSYLWSYSILGQGMGGTNTAIDPNGNETDYAYYSYYPQFGNCSQDLESSEKKYQGSGSSATLLSTVTKTYLTTAAPVPYPVGNDYPVYGNPVPQTVTSTPDSQSFSTTTTTQYAGSFSAEMPTCEFEYDTSSQSYVCPLLPSGWNPSTTLTLSIPQSDTTTDYSGSTIKTTTTWFQWQNNSSYLAANLLDTPNTVTTTNSGVETAQTTYTYDDPTYSSCGTCGHVTEVQEWLDTNPSASPTTSIGWNHGQIAYSIDPDGHKNANGHTVDYTYSGGSDPNYPFPASVENALNQTTAYTWDLNTGNETSVTDPNSQQTQYTYDCPSPPYNCSGRIWNVQHPDGGTVQYSYSTDSSPTTFPETITAITAINSTESMTNVSVFDGLGRVIQTQLRSDPDGTDYINTAYDGLDQIISVTNPFRSTSDPTYGVTTYTYDALGRKVLQQNQDGTTKSQWCYDAISVVGQANCVAQIGNVNPSTWVDFTDESGNHWQRSSDALGRLTELIEDASGSKLETNYQYDALDDLVQIDQWGGAYGNSGDRIRSFIYDSLSRLTNACNPETIATGSTCSSSGPWSDVYTYDSNSNVQSKTEARNLTIGYTYDNLNRVEVETNPSGTANACFWYDNSSVSPAPSGCPAPPSGLATGTYLVGRMSYEWTADGKTGTAFGYDSMGRVNAESVCTPSTCGSSTYSLAFNHDFTGDQTSYSNGFGVTISMGYDGADRLAQVTSSFNDSNHPGTLWTANSYSAIGLAEATLGNGITQAVGYDNRERKTSEIFTNPSNYQNIYSYTLGFFPNSSVQTTNDSANGNWTYTLDNLNRLYTATVTGGPYSGTALQWSVDPWGNRNVQTATAGSAPEPSFSSNSNNQIAGYCYDAAGNLLDEGTCAIGTHAFTYDGAGRLISPDQGGTYYVYDAAGNRVAKQSNGVSNYEYLYDLNGNQITEIAAQTSYLWNRGEVYAGSRHIATYIGGTTYFAHTDWLGNERVHSKMDASIQDSCANLPYGDDLICTGNGVNPLHFTGKERDTESGNDYFGARYYASSMGRFLSPDPLGPWVADSSNPQTWNMYTYGLNSPLINTDPTGYDCVYFNDNGTGIDPNGIDHNSNSSECGQNGGDWINGHVTTATYFSDSDTWGFRSSDSNNNYLTYANAPGTEMGGYTCSGNCDTANGYFQTSNGGPSTDDNWWTQPLAPSAQQFVQQVAQQTHTVNKAGDCVGAAAVGFAPVVTPDDAKDVSGALTDQGLDAAEKGLNALSETAVLSKGVRVGAKYLGKAAGAAGAALGVHSAYENMKDAGCFGGEGHQ